MQTTSPHPLIAAALAMPNTHRVVTIYAGGKVRTFETRSELTAENHAVHDRRNVGRDLIDRESGDVVRIVSVVVESIAASIVDKWAARLGLGFHPDTPGADYAPALSPDEVRTYDADVAKLFEISQDPYADAIDAWKRAGLI